MKMPRKRLIDALIIFVIFVVLALLAIPRSTDSPISAQLTLCRNQAKQIYLGCAMYASDHEGRFPQNLDELFPTYLQNKDVLFSPLTKDQSVMAFDYFGGTTADAPDKVLLRSKPFAKEHGQVIIHRDGSVTSRSR